jgi:hypothetical protein
MKCSLEFLDVDIGAGDEVPKAFVLVLKAYNSAIFGCRIVLDQRGSDDAFDFRGVNEIFTAPHDRGIDRFDTDAGHGGDVRIFFELLDQSFPMTEFGFFGIHRALLYVLLIMPMGPEVKWYLRIVSASFLCSWGLYRARHLS